MVSLSPKASFSSIHLLLDNDDTQNQRWISPPPLPNTFQWEQGTQELEGVLEAGGCDWEVSPLVCE